MDIETVISAYAYPDRTPWLRANMIATLDGAITYQGSPGPLGYSGDRELMQRLRTLADVVIMGATTIREYDTFPPSAPRLAIVSRSLNLDVAGPLFSQKAERPIVITASSAPPERLKAVEQRAEVVVCGTGSVDVGQALGELAAQGYARQLCEGGPTLLAEIAAAGWLHELCLTLSPTITAGDAARILNGPAIDIQRMRLEHAIHDGDYLFLRYRIPDEA